MLNRTSVPHFGRSAGVVPEGERLVLSLFGLGLMFFGTRHKPRPLQRMPYLAREARPSGQLQCANSP